MFRLAWNNPYGFDASGSGDLMLPPPTMLTDAFVTAHTKVLHQLLQAQQRDGSATAANATVATEGPTFQALFT
jgi:hypothetical protein